VFKDLFKSLELTFFLASFFSIENNFGMDSQLLNSSLKIFRSRSSLNKLLKIVKDNVCKVCGIAEANGRHLRKIKQGQKNKYSKAKTSAISEKNSS
jgi:hypothetical protein